MYQNVELLKEKLFSRSMKSNEIMNSLEKEDFIHLFSPLNYNSIHDSNRVVLFDSILEVLIRYYNLNETYNGFYIIHKDTITHTIRGVHRYLFHGGDKGRFDGFFSNNDDFFIIRKSNKTAYRTADSVPKWNMAHFFCDYLDTDDKSKCLVSWIFSDFYWSDSMMLRLSSSFSSSSL